LGNKILNNVGIGVCFNACQKDRKCKSFDYNSTMLRCSLSKKTAAQAGGLVKKSYIPGTKVLFPFSDKWANSQKK